MDGEAGLGAEPWHKPPQSPTGLSCPWASPRLQAHQVLSAGAVVSAFGSRLKEPARKMGERDSTRVWSDKTRGNGFKLTEIRSEVRSVNKKKNRKIR